MSVADELKKLSDLHREGVLTDAEFDAQKRAVLGASSTEQTDPPPASEDGARTSAPISPQAPRSALKQFLAWKYAPYTALVFAGFRARPSKAV
jgi:hypothetical protein